MKHSKPVGTHSVISPDYSKQSKAVRRGLRLILIPFKTVGLVFRVQSLFKLWVLRQFKKGLV